MPRTPSRLFKGTGLAAKVTDSFGFKHWLRAGRTVVSTWGTAESGIYILELCVARDIRVEVGALGRCRFPAGRFLYVGRAMRGLEARLARHLRKKKVRPRWHIDHLRAEANLVNVWVLPSADPGLECRTASRLLASGGRIEIPGFGSSDCLCPSHLLFYPS